MVTRQTMPRTIQNISATGQVQLCRLLDETSTSPSNPPQTHEKRIINTTHFVGNVKNRTKQRQPSSRSSNIKCSESEHLRGCDDLAVYDTRTVARPQGKCTIMSILS